MIIEIISIFLVAFFFYNKLTKRPIGMPPGDWGIPIFGKLPKGKKGMADLITSQRKKYGNIFSVKIGSRLFVFLTDYKLIKTGLSKSEFSGRPDSFTLSSISFFTGFGIVIANGHIWQHNRRFALKALREFGMGKSKIEHFVEFEVTELLSFISKTTDVPVDISKHLQIAILNIIWQIVANKRYDLTDPVITNFNEASYKIEALAGGVCVIDFLPWLEYLPTFIKNRWLHVDEIRALTASLKKLMDTEIDAHVKTFDKNKIRDLIDKYLLDIDGEIEDPENHFKKDLSNLSATIVNLFMGGSDTTTMTLLWFFMYTCKHPEVQDKIQKEIENEVGKERRPCLNDRDKLPYLEATLHEVNRIVSLLPNSFFHLTTEDTELDGYQIPKGTFVTPCIELCHKSPEYFDDPEAFRPERFLNSEGKVETKIDGYLPFSIGRRACIGESLAMTELFLFTSAILQKFRVTVSGNADLDLTPDPNDPLFNHPKLHLFTLKRR